MVLAHVLISQTWSEYSHSTSIIRASLKVRFQVHPTLPKVSHNFTFRATQDIDAVILYNPMRHAMHMTHLWAKRDLALPCALRQTQSLDQVLPPGTTSLLLPQVGQMFLSPVHQQPQVPLIDSVSMSSRLTEVRQSPDLGRQDRNLHFRAAGVWACTLLLFHYGSGVNASRLGIQSFVGVVATKGIDTTLGVDTQAILRTGKRQGRDTPHSFCCIGRFLCDLGSSFLLCELSNE
jgi:hypothetical protein